jgi:hypothetical protein
MSLFSKPQIDTAAINSSTSENSLMQVLSELNGFISRKEMPDKGCDFMCELIEGSSVTGQKFPVQLKSIESLSLVENETYISYPLLTSRLGYMLSHLPTTGIIVFYDVEKERLFYDFSDAVYDRLMSERGTDEWTKNESVNIRIPTIKTLDENSVKQFHSKILERFRQAAKMQVANGKKYDLPSINLSQKFQFDFNNIDHLKLLLKQYGLVFLSSYDISIIYKTISKLTANDINSDKEILILAAISYCEAGRYAESDIFIRRLRVQHDLSESQKKMIDYVDSKNQLILGLIDNSIFLDKLRALKQNSESDSVIVDINILRYQLIDLKSGEVDNQLKLELNNIFESIEKSNASETMKQLYKIWNSENESIIISHNLTYQLGLYKVKAAVGSDLSLNEKKAFIEGYLKDELIFLGRINEIYKKAYQDKNIFVQATALSANVTHFLQKLISFIAQDFPMTDYGEELKRHFQFAFQAYQYYAELDMLKDSHYCLCNAIEILEAAKETQNPDVIKDIETLSSTKILLEKELLLPPSPLIIPGLIEELKSRKANRENQPGMYSVKDMNDQGLDLYANMAIKAYNLPANRFQNVLNELKAYRLFYNRCQDSNIEVLQNNFSMYQFPVEFTLRNKVSQIQTIRSSDMELLLSSLGY